MNSLIKVTIIFLLQLVFIKTHAQSSELINYNFKDTTFIIPDQFKSFSEINLERHFKYEINTSGKESIEYFLFHNKVLVNSDDAIQKNNKIYIHFERDQNLLLNKNRVILPDGNVLQLSDNDIKEEKDEETDEIVSYYAVKGLVKGAIIEQIYLIARQPELNSTYVFFQDDSPILWCDFEYKYPEHLKFYYKSYNGLGTANSTFDSISHTNVLSLSDTNIEPFDVNQRYVNINKEIRKFRYKLYENYKTGVRNFYNYKSFTNDFVNMLEVPMDSRSNKSVLKLIENMPTNSNNFDKLLWIENKIKETVAINNYYNKNKTVGDILVSKQANITDIVKLYYKVISAMGIPFEIVMTSNRNRNYFDPEFETTNYFDRVLFYFPDLDMYMDLNDAIRRIPLFNFVYGNNYGLFLKLKEFGGTKMAVSEVKYIKIPGLDVTTDTMDIVIDFTKNIENPVVHSKIIFGGHSGVYLQAAKDQIDATNYKLFLDERAKNYGAEVSKISIDVLNDGIENISKKHITYILNFEGGELVQKAGDKYLFKIGEIIGKQVELYQETDRKNPVELDFPHGYHRTIQVKIPEGYKIANPDAVNLYHDVIQDGQKVAKWESKYEINGQNLVIRNVEYYEALNYPPNQFKDYQKVVNAAADFNKIVFVFERIK